MTRQLKINNYLTFLPRVIEQCGSAGEKDTGRELFVLKFNLLLTRPLNITE